MKIYFAGISGNKKRLDYLRDFGANKLMLTFAEAKSYNKQMPRFKEMGFEILFDSGAFSLHNRGIEICPEEYFSFLLKHDIKNYINLDRIGDPLKTKENQLRMEGFGAFPIPVFHLNSEMKHLEELIEKYEYICLGGTVGSKRGVRIDFFNSVFSRFPDHKFHGLGVTDSSIIKQFPFYSVDSTTWLCAQKVGRILDENGKQVHPKEGMTVYEKFENTIGYFSKLEKELELLHST